MDTQRVPGPYTFAGQKHEAVPDALPLEAAGGSEEPAS